MKEYNIDGDEDFEGGDFPALPAANYPVKCTGVKETTTAKGDDMWNLTLTVIGGEFDGRLIFDRVVFSDAAENRVKLIFSRLGGIKGSFTPEPIMLLQRVCVIETIIEEYEGKDKCKVSFNGYLESGAESGSGASQSNNTPF